MIKRDDFKRRSRIWNLGNQRSVMGCSDFEQELPVLLRSKKKKLEQLYDSGGSRTSSIEVLELRVTYMGKKTVVVSLTCRKRTDTMAKLCDVFESLKLKIIPANITAFSGRVLKTVFIEENNRNELESLDRESDMTGLYGNVERICS